MKQVLRNAEVRLSEDQDRTVQFVISDSSKDRHGTVLNMANWNLDNFNANGIVGYQHDVYGAGMCRPPDPDSVIGAGRSWLEGNKLIGEVKFEPKEINETADKVFKKVKHGTLKATSVGFKPMGGGTMVDDESGERTKMETPPKMVPKGKTFHYEGQELLEFSIVSIPSNPNALKRDLRDQTANALHFLKRELGQGITYGQIEQMRVLDVIKMLETGDKPKIRTSEVPLILDVSKIASLYNKIEKKEIQESVFTELESDRNTTLKSKIKTIQSWIMNKHSVKQ